jgi:hypothetical protein
MKCQPRPFVLLAVLTIGNGLTTSAENVGAQAREQVQPAEPRQTVPPRTEPRPVTMRAGTLAVASDEFAGFEVRLVDARVVGVLEPHAFVIEPATRYMKTMGQRDRLLVLLDAAALRVAAETLVGSTVRVTGVARSLLGMQVTREAAWPAQLNEKTIERWEVRAAVLASSVQSPEGVELTDKRPR